MIAYSSNTIRYCDVLKLSAILKRTTTIGMSSQKKPKATAIIPRACMNHGSSRLSRSW